MLCLVIWFFWFQFFKLDYIYVGQCRYFSMRGSFDIFHKMFFSSMLKYLVNFKAKARQLPEIFVPYLQQKSKCFLTFKWAPSNQPKSWATLWRMACLVSINSMNLSLYYFLIFWDEFERWCGVSTRIFKFVYIFLLISSVINARQFIFGLSVLLECYFYLFIFFSLRLCQSKGKTINKRIENKHKLEEFYQSEVAWIAN